MTQEDKELLLKDLSARLPYKVKCQIAFDEEDIHIETLESVRPTMLFNHVTTSGSVVSIENVKPYLRSMSSMTEEERIEFIKLFNKWHDDELFDYIEEGTEFSIWKHKGISPVVFDWLNVHHFDYRGLIEKGLALEAEEEMYNL